MGSRISVLHFLSILTHLLLHCLPLFFLSSLPPSLPHFFFFKKEANVVEHFILSFIGVGTGAQACH